MKQKSCLVVIKLLQWEIAICKTCVRAHYIESLKDVPKFKMGHLNLKFEFKNVKVFFFFGVCKIFVFSKIELNSSIVKHLYNSKYN